MRSSRRSSPRPRVLLVVGIGLLLVAGCGAAPAASTAAPVISGAWVRLQSGPDRPAAGYLTITNRSGTADALTGVTSPAAVSVELHRTTMDSGMAAMHPVTSMHIPAGGTVTLEPGGFHLMLIGPRSMAPGDTVDLVLTFEKAGPVTVKAEVKNG